MASLEAARNSRVNQEAWEEDGLQQQDEEEDDDDEDRNEPRPSFTDFWKRNQEEYEARNLRFVESRGAPGNGDFSGVGNDGRGRAQARRAQVRKAQIHHRQRKANYTKELEMDIVRLREMIQQVEGESRELRSENDAIRQQLSMKAVTPGSVDTSISMSAGTSFNCGIPELPMMTRWSAAPGPEYTVCLELNDQCHTPVFTVSRTPSGSEGSQSMNTFPVGGTEADMASPEQEPLPETLASGLSKEQIDMAINFILSLEHICWDHFDHSYYAHKSHSHLGNEHGHSLMASSIALQHAPPTVFNRIDAVQSSLHSDPDARPPTGDIAWKATGLTLGSLYSLANTLNPPDQELAPVQAWFEIAREYGPWMALDAEVLERLKREFQGVVKCLHFGAVIERDAFDSVVGRVVTARWEELETSDRVDVPEMDSTQE